MSSFKFLGYICLFLPAVMLAYHLAPQKFRWAVLLAASYIFFIIDSGVLLAYLLISTLVVYLCALWIEKYKGQEKESLRAAASKEEKKLIKSAFARKKNLIAALALAINFGIIAVLKYSPFFGSIFGIQTRYYLLPLGISFYTMMAASYIIDVKRGTISADRHIGRVALFLGFFPQIMEGPMCRYSDTAEQLFTGNPLEYKNICRGFQRIAIGMAKRMLVADRVNNYVGWMYEFYDGFDGGMLALASLCYLFQLYMDFSGTMDIVLGSAEIFGIKLPENFKRPFFSRTISEFWTRWHITLGTWFRDYIFYPVSMSKPMKKLSNSSRKKLGNYYGPLTSGTVALMLVWLCNGLWHGSGWQFLFFGFYYFALILIGNLIQPPSRFVLNKLHINSESTAYRIFQAIRTLLLVNLGEIFFRAPDLQTAFAFIGKMAGSFTFASLFNGTVFKYWLDPCDICLLMAVLILLVIIGIKEEKGHDIRDDISSLKPCWRWAIYAALVMACIIMGGYGTGYSYVEPIYAKF